MIFNRAIAALALLVCQRCLADGVLKGDAAAGEALSALAQPATVPTVTASHQRFQSLQALVSVTFSSR